MPSFSSGRVSNQLFKFEVHFLGFFNIILFQCMFSIGSSIFCAQWIILYVFTNIFWQPDWYTGIWGSFPMKQHNILSINSKAARKLAVATFLQFSTKTPRTSILSKFDSSNNSVERKIDFFFLLWQRLTNANWFHNKAPLGQR